MKNRKLRLTTLVVFISFITTSSIFSQQIGEIWQCQTSQSLKSAELLSGSYDLNAKVVDIFVHIIRNNNGTDGLTNNQVDNTLNQLRFDYEGRNVFFNEVGREFIDNDFFFDGITDISYPVLVSTNNHNNAIDIYFLSPDDFYARSNGIPGRELAIGGAFQGTSVISHEMGHCLGLFHTHSGRGCNDNANCSENINGSNCNTCGDLICDTPADPCLSGNVDIFCNYIGDPAFAPLVDNLMSYSPPLCLENLTNGQNERVHNYITNSSVLQAVTDYPYMNSPNIVCYNGASFSIYGLPSYTNLTWTYSSNLQSFYGGSNYIALRATSDGPGWVQASVLTAIGQMSLIKYVWVGNPDFTLVGTNELYTFDIGFVATANINGKPINSDDEINPRITSTSWSYSGPLTSIFGDVDNATFRSGRNLGPGYIYANSTNQCGTTEKRMYYQVQQAYLYYPNPASEELTVEILSNEFESRKSGEKYNVKILDRNLQIIVNKDFNVNKTKVNLNKCNNGLYFIELVIKDQVYMEKLLIKK
jgi:hypothetical protein